MHLCIYYRFQQTISFNPFDLFSILTRRERKEEKKKDDRSCGIFPLTNNYRPLLSTCHFLAPGFCHLLFAHGRYNSFQIEPPSCPLNPYPNPIFRYPPLPSSPKKRTLLHFSPFPLTVPTFQHPSPVFPLFSTSPQLSLSPFSSLHGGLHISTSRYSRYHIGAESSPLFVPFGEACRRPWKNWVGERERSGNRERAMGHNGWYIGGSISS